MVHVADGHAHACRRGCEFETHRTAEGLHTTAVIAAQAIPDSFVDSFLTV